MPDAHSHWVNDSNTRSLTQLGVTAARPTIIAGLATLYRRSIEHYLDKGLDTEEARIRTETDFIRPGLNRAGRQVWQIEAGQIGKLKHWIADEKKWVSSGNYDRLKTMGITSGDLSLDRLFEQLHAEALYAQKEQGKSPKQAATYVETRCYRKATTEQGLPTWQMHQRMAKTVRQAIHDPEWISSHDKAAFARHGMTAITDRIDPALAAHHAKLLTILSGTRSPAEAQAYITHHMLRPATTRYGTPAWEVHREHMPMLAKAVRELDMRRSGDWISYTSPRLGLAGNIETRRKLILELRDERITFHQEAGLSEPEAKMKVELDEISQRQGLVGRPVLKLHQDLLPALHQKAGALTRPESWASRLNKSEGPRER